MNIADESLTDCSFLSRYHCTKSKNYLKRRYRVRHGIPMFIGTPCSISNCLIKKLKCLNILMLIKEYLVRFPFDIFFYVDTLFLTFFVQFNVKIKCIFGVFTSLVTNIFCFSNILFITKCHRFIWKGKVEYVLFYLQNFNNSLVLGQNL